MKRLHFLICPVLFLLLFIILQAFLLEPKPVVNEQELLSKANLFNLKFPQEKIYLHLDRNSYWANDDIWFKAYLKNSPIPESNLYVELVSSKGAVVYKNLCWAQNGLAYGDFHLADTLSSGVYQIRAYTDWLRNFDDAWFFRKNLVIWNLRDKQANIETNDLKAKEIDMQFFPEGGTFISGLKNRVAFKAIDKNGKGIDLEGEITDDRGNKITEIKSEFRGMGSFVFVPEENRKYSAQVVVAGKITLQVNLPDSQKEGVALAVDPADTSNIQITVSAKSRTSDKIQGTDYLLVGQAGGGICYRNKVGTTGKLLIDRNSLPSGIVKFTLFDPEMVPRCERLVFINHHDNIDIEIKPDKTDYITREKVQLDLEAFSGAGIPYNSNLSVSVYNPENQLETEKYPDNILTHFLLNSELRGTIEEPAYYFKDDSLTTQLALDNLMLTHGYRQFEWKEIREDKYPEIVYQPKGCIELGGIVKSTIRNKPLPKAKVSMMTVKSLLATYSQTTDSLGHFLFSDLFFNDTVYVSLQAVNDKGNRNTEIEIDERSNNSPKADFLPFSYRYEKESEILTSAFLSELSPEIINRKWRLSDTILLGDINIMARKKKKDDGHVRPYLEADYVVDVSKMDDIGDFMESLMVYSPTMRSFQAHSLNFNMPIQHYLDGVPVDPGFIYGKPQNWFDKVEFLKMAPGKHGFGPGIYFYTKRGAPQEKVYEALGVKSAQIIGYSVIRKFYSPNYETLPPSETKNDFRNTLYWNPIVRTDSTGVAKIDFYNSDQIGEVLVVVEGVAADGKICRGVYKYNVVPK